MSLAIVQAAFFSGFTINPRIGGSAEGAVVAQLNDCNNFDGLSFERRRPVFAAYAMAALDRQKFVFCCRI
jgi:hypothetical protein